MLSFHTITTITTSPAMIINTITVNAMTTTFMLPIIIIKAVTLFAIATTTTAHKMTDNTVTAHIVTDSTVEKYLNFEIVVVSDIYLLE